MIFECDIVNSESDNYAQKDAGVGFFVWNKALTAFLFRQAGTVGVAHLPKPVAIEPPSGGVFI